MRSPDHTRRVVVTGLGVVSPVGNDKDTAWENLIEGSSGLGEITRFDTTPYDAHRPAQGPRLRPDRVDGSQGRSPQRAEMHFGVAAAKQAIADSGFEINDANRTEVGVVFGSGAGGQQLMIDNYSTLKERGPNACAPTFIANAPRRLRRRA